MMDNYNLKRFITAQQSDFPRALSEIQAGKKRTHWMWYSFPQLRSLGRSATAEYYGIADLEEAKAYMADPYLRENLITITKALLSVDESRPRKVMGYPDDLKLCSCMTLFEIASPEVPEFGMVLEKFYGGERDEKTVEILNEEA
ncbi:MAG: DUF1810 domain-containing protein [Clostridiales bacterium]|nr:DUF1810 domain-containing protein [Clostridiales bacterium]